MAPLFRGQLGPGRQRSRGIRRHLLSRPALLTLILFFLVFVMTIFFSVFMLPNEQSRRIQYAVRLQNLRTNRSKQPAFQSRHSSTCLKPWEEGREDEKVQAAIDQYLQERCDIIHVARALRVVQALQPFPHITQEQVCHICTLHHWNAGASSNWC
jgi:hypothetical protein